MAKAELLYTINLVLGDPSHDGHNQSDTVVIKSNLTLKQLETAYELGSKVVGFDLTADVAAEYEDSTISDEYMSKLKEQGFDTKKFKADRAEDGSGYSLWCDAFTQLWLFIAKVGAPDFRHRLVKGDMIHVGGYGLYR